ncbi:hypothetical protein JI735_17470 [Paenibacillus sonchi]|uniref:Uncharacterized protein n=1 Tax=Paenibacillus sonchi TaxID=373687 RepID=A0A974P6V4_9BACL|nr:hypothetical protein [Paenibacillus sonchi]QQZ58589.1 hypothetical protein JI735_17470 [Paenibacillus sonchi]
MDRRFGYSTGQRTQVPLFVAFPFIPGPMNDITSPESVTAEKVRFLAK